MFMFMFLYSFCLVLLSLIFVSNLGKKQRTECLLIYLVIKMIVIISYKDCTSNSYRFLSFLNSRSTYNSLPDMFCTTQTHNVFIYECRVSMSLWTRFCHSCIMSLSLESGEICSRIADLSLHGVNL